MPNGKVHRRWSARALPTAVAAAVAVWFFGGSPIAYLSGYAVGFLATPDADLVTVTEGERIALTFLPPVSWFIGAVWLAIWTSYAYAMTHFGGHRGASHWPIVGTATRIVWLAVWVVLVTLPLAPDKLHFIVAVVASNPVSAASFFAGLAHNDIIHWFMDATEEIISWR